MMKITHNNTPSGNYTTDIVFGKIDFGFAISADGPYFAAFYASGGMRYMIKADNILKIEEVEE